MSKEQTKAAHRRLRDGGARYFVGDGIDIGCGDDPVSNVIFPAITSLKEWDLSDGDAQYMITIPNDKYDFVHSSHSLEHMINPYIALGNWIRITKPGGHLIIAVPDENLYEHGYWPSRYGSIHYHSFTIYKPLKIMPNSINLIDMLTTYSTFISIERIMLIRDNYDETLGDADQTRLNAECAIEFILRKK